MKEQLKEIRIDEYTTEADVRGKYAWNDSHQIGGVIGRVNERGAEIGGTWHSTITGDSVYDSLYINGFKVYEQTTQGQA